MTAKEKLMTKLGLIPSDFQPTDKTTSERINDVESQTNDALTELANLQGETEINLTDIQEALMEIAEIIGGL